MISQRLKLRDVVAAMSAYSNSNYGAQFGFRGNLAPCADYAMLRSAEAAAVRLGVTLRIGPVYSSDIFYDQSSPSPAEILETLGVLAVNGGPACTSALRAEKTLALLTISDNPKTGKRWTACGGGRPSPR